MSARRAVHRRFPRRNQEVTERDPRDRGHEQSEDTAEGRVKMTASPAVCEVSRLHLNPRLPSDIQGARLIGLGETPELLRPDRVRWRGVQNGLANPAQLAAELAEVTVCDRLADSRLRPCLANPKGLGQSARIDPPLVDPLPPAYGHNGERRDQPDREEKKVQWLMRLVLGQVGIQGQRTLNSCSCNHL